MKPIQIIVAATLAAGIAGPAIAHRPDAATMLAAAIRDRVAGKPVECIDLPQVGARQTVDGTALIYTVGATVYVNKPAGAEALRDDDILVTRISDTQLCRLDQVRLLDPASRMLRGVVTLGDFVPYTRR